MTHVSVVIVSYYTGPALDLALASALAQPECKEVILVDNGNIPGVQAQLEQMAQKYAPRMRMVTGQGNVGFAKACNLGAKCATGDYILLLNPDSMLPEGGLARALDVMTRFPAKTLAGCYVLNPDGTEQRGSRRALLSPKNAIVEALGMQRLLNGSDRLNQHQTPMPESVHEVPAISGACMLLSRAFFEEMGGLDEGYFLHMEDMDLCYRVHQAGGKVICMPEVNVLHFGSTSGASSAIVERHKARGFIHYLRTHFSAQYPAIFLHIMTLGIWLRYVLKLCFQTFDRLFVPPLEEKQEIIRLVLLYKLALFSIQTQELTGKTVLVTGACGQIGLQVVGKALAQGAHVIALYHQTQVQFEHPRLRWIQQDLSKEFFLPADIKADVLIHTPVLWLLPKMLTLFVKQTGIKRVIAFSSTAVLSKTTSRNTSEKEMVKNLLQAEDDIWRISKELGLQTTLLRPTMIYGAGLDNNITRLAYAARRFGMLPIYAPAKGFRHPVQSADLADAALTILGQENTFDKTYNMGGSESLTYRAMLEKIFQYIGRKPWLVPMPMMPQVLDALGFVYQINSINGEMARRMNRDLLFDISDAVRDFGYQPHGFLEGDVIV